MKKTILLTLLVSLTIEASPLRGKERKLYVGSDSSEAILSFAGQVELMGVRQPDQRQILDQVDQQVTHLFGPMGEATVVAVPRGNHQISQIRVAPKGNGAWTINYLYQGTIVVKNTPESTYPVVLPVNPDTAYRDECTDPHYQVPEYFWYFWNPYRRGCRMQEGRDFLVLTGNLQRLPNTKVSFPEYERLADAQGTIRISLLMGMDDPGLGRDPNRSKDVNATNYRALKNGFLNSGWSARRLDLREIQQIVQEPIPRGDEPFVEEFTKISGRGTQAKKLSLLIFFGASGIDENAVSFQWFLKDAMEKSSIMIYAGHSGLGEHLDLKAIEKERGFVIRPAMDRYQIYFFNSCSSYPYYNSQYFARKIQPQDPRGTRQLDILTNGLSTYFHVLPDTIFALVNAVDAAAAGRLRVNYQTLARQIDTGNLFGVNGDEDNPVR